MSAVPKVTRCKYSRLVPTPKTHKPLQRDRTGLPIPPVRIFIRDTHPCRLADHYYQTVQDDLMYLTYKHEHGPRPPPRVIRPTYDPENPYTKNRFNPPIGGFQLWRKEAPPTTSENVT